MAATRRGVTACGWIREPVDGADITSIGAVDARWTPVILP